MVVIDPSHVINNCLPHLIDEIAILKPKVIVAVGNEVFKVLSNYLPEENVVKMPHYAPRYKPEDFAEVLGEKLKEIKEVRF